MHHLTHAISHVLAQGDTPATDEASKTIFTYIQDGGNVGYLILLLSLVAIAMIISQLISLRIGRVSPAEAEERLRELLSRRDAAGALRYCEQDGPDCVLTRTMGGAIARCTRSPFGYLELPAAIEDIGKQEMARLGRVTDGVGLVASIAPMLGLLGTVIGMVGAFDVIAQTEGPVRPDQLAGNISEALITTVLGLIVAIPTTAMHTYLRNRIEQLATDAGEIMESLASYLQGPGGAQQQAASAGQAARPAGPAVGSTPGQTGGPAGGPRPMPGKVVGPAPTPAAATGAPKPNPGAAPVRPATGN